MSDADKILSAMRGMAWERAKAELASLGAADYPPAVATTADRLDWENKCDRRRDVISAFVEKMESEELWN